MPTTRTLLLGTLLAAACLACRPSRESAPGSLDGPRASAAYQPRWEDAECWAAFPAAVPARCGYVVVPQDRARPWTERNTARLAVAILGEPSPQRRSVPTILLGGGPGQALVGMLAALANEYAAVAGNGLATEQYPGHAADAAEFRRVFELLVADLGKRELVLLDQRGAGFSQPTLRCGRESWRDCRLRLEREGADVASFNTVENAADVEDVRRVLGHERVNLQGGSYGTRLALEVMRRYPASVRAAVLDGVAPPQVDWPVEMAARYGAALHVLFEHCRLDAACSAAYPELEARFYALVERLESRPVMVTVAGEAHALDGDDLHELVWNALYDAQRIRFLPLMIHRLAAGETAVLERLLASAGANADGIAWGAHYSMDCAERWVFARPDQVAAAARELHPAIRAGVTRQFVSTFEICEDWGAPAASRTVHAPVASDVPTLLLSGEFDPGTPPAFAELAAATLEHHYSYVLPYLGHTDGFVSYCHASLVSAFLDDPAHAPDTTCIARADVARFAVQ